MTVDVADVILGVVVLFGLVAVIVGAGQQKRANRGAIEASRRSSARQPAHRAPREEVKQAPTFSFERVRFTAEFIDSCDRIARAKKNVGSISKKERVWLDYMALKICRIGLDMNQLTDDHKFAAIFLVNEVFHNHSDSRIREVARLVKNVLQKSLKHVVVQPGSGRYANTIELKHPINRFWSSHIPVSLVKKWIREGRRQRRR